MICKRERWCPRHRPAPPRGSAMPQLGCGDGVFAVALRNHGAVQSRHCTTILLVQLQCRVPGKAKSLLFGTVLRRRDAVATPFLSRSTALRAGTALRRRGRRRYILPVAQHDLAGEHGSPTARAPSLPPALLFGIILTTGWQFFVTECDGRRLFLRECSWHDTCLRKARQSIIHTRTKGTNNARDRKQ